MALDADSVVNLALGILEIVLALVVLRGLGRFGRALPWLSVLLLFFAIRGVDRIYAALSDSERLGLVVDLALVAVVVALILTIDRTAAAIKTTEDDARLRREEYERALADYHRLARHRLANPITAIRGSIATLRDLPDLDAETQRRLLDAVELEAARLERIALDPELRSAEERGLDPQPNV